MGVISQHDNIGFKSAKFIYSKVKRFLKSFDAVNIIDEGEFPTLTKEVLKSLGSGVYKESQAIIEICNGVGDLPCDFSYIWTAYKCTGSHNNKDIKKHLQNSSFGFTTETSYKSFIEGNTCEIKCCEDKSKLVESFEVKHYITESPENYTFKNPIGLRLVTRDLSANGGTFNELSNYEIAIEGKKIYTNFDSDYVYMKYYGFPVDENGEILIPDIEQVEKAIEWYIIWQILLSGWFNSTIPDIQNKFQYAENQYNFWFAEAKYHRKLPSFTAMVDIIRNNNKNNKLVFLTEQHSGTNFNRTR